MLFTRLLHVRGEAPVSLHPKQHITFREDEAPLQGKRQVGVKGFADQSRGNKAPYELYLLYPGPHPHHMFLRFKGQSKAQSQPPLTIGAKVYALHSVYEKLLFLR